MTTLVLAACAAANLLPVVPQPREWKPAGTLLTCNPEQKRLYLHLVDYPAMLPLRLAFADRVRYAQFLNDASEILLEGDVLKLPKIAPSVIVPVVELYLK